MTNQRKDSCSKSYAICSVYEGNIPTSSPLTEEECVSVEEVLEDLYSITTDIKEGISMTDISEGCLEFPTTPTLPEVIQLLVNEICALKEIVETQAETIETINLQIEALQENQCP
jgi:hypothetical protein